MKRQKNEDSNLIFRLMNSKYISSLIVCLLIMGCTKSNDEINIEPGEYTRILFLQVEEAANAQTKAIDGVGVFTAKYDPEPDDRDGGVVDPPLQNDYIYIHSTTEADKWVRYNIKNDLPSCNGCDGFQFEIRKNEDGTITLINGLDAEGQPKGEVTFNADEQIYFSSIPDEVWEGTSEEASPVTGQSVLIRDAKKNKELYRSEKNYKISDLITGENGLSEELVMKRKCSAFRIYFLFTELDEPSFTTPGTGNVGRNEYYIIEEDDFVDKTGHSLEEWNGKLYIGPCFSDFYNVNTGIASYKEGHSDGYYVTNEQEYTGFTPVTYARTEGTVTQNFTGFGVSTANSKYLITPYDEHNEDPFYSYVFIKDNNTDPSSDSGAKYFSYDWSTGTPEFNTTQVIVLVYDVDELLKAFPKSTDANTKSNYWKEPQKLDIKPGKVFFIQ